MASLDKRLDDIEGELQPQLTNFIVVYHYPEDPEGVYHTGGDEQDQTITQAELDELKGDDTAIICVEYRDSKKKVKLGLEGGQN